MDRTGGNWTDQQPANGDVQGIRVSIVGNDYAELNKVTTIKFKAQPRFKLRTGKQISLDQQTINPGEVDPLTVVNTVSADVSRLGKDAPVENDDATLTFKPSKSGAAVSKSNNAPKGQISAGGQLNYTITVTNNGTEPIIKPVITYGFPVDGKGPLLTVEDDWASNLKYTFTPGKFGQVPDGTALPTEVENIAAQKTADGSKLTFAFPENAVLYPGDSVTIVVPAFIRAGVTAGATGMDNTVEFSGENIDEPLTGKSNVAIIEGQAYASQKLVREVLTGGQEKRTGVYNVLTGIENDPVCYEFEGGFYRYPCVVQTKPGGTAEWQLQVTNTGNVPSQHMEILDVFPHLNDFGVTESQKATPRGSKWVPTIQDIKLPEVPEGTEMVLHYLIGSPADCKPTGSNNDPWAGCKDGWTTDRPLNPKDIHGLKLVMDFAEGLQPGESVALTFTTTSLTDMPEDTREFAPAWNSFGFAAQAQVNGETDYRSQEPIKTGITFRVPEVPLEKVSVGDYVWLDENKDGIQDDSEKGIKDVTLVLTGPDGKPVTDVFGNPVLPTMTDANGHYTFENLPVLEKGQSYTVSIDKKASDAVLKPYLPTKVGAGDDKTKDSSGWVAVSDPESDLLTKDGDRDPSLDFGFFLNPGRVSVGDYVWVDSDRDGAQGDPKDEPGIEGVVLILVGPNGDPVTDVFGNLVTSVTTDENGAYTFENLPVLKDGESYTVKIDKEASAGPLAPYIPTIDTGVSWDELFDVDPSLRV